MKHVAVFHPSNELYGADRILVNAVDAMPDDVRPIVYLRSTGPLVEHLHTHAPRAVIRIVLDMPVIYRALFTPRGIFQFIRQWLRFRSWLKAENKRLSFHAAYVNTLSCSLLLPILRSNGIRTFLHVHEILDRPRSIGWLTAWLARKFADRIICVSGAVRDGLERYGGPMKGKLVVIHNGIDPIEAAAHSPNGTTHFALFGRIKPEKGQWFLIDALGHVDPKLIPRIRISLIGGTAPGQDRSLEELKERIHGAGLADQITIQGFTADISNAMAATDVCLVPSMMQDPFPTTVLEAMSAGRPVIATNHGGAKEVIIDGENGSLIAPGDAKAFAKSLERYASQADLVRTHGQAAKSCFQKGFTRATFHKAWQSEIRSILDA